MLMRARWLPLMVWSLVARPGVRRLRLDLEEAEDLLADLRRRKAVYDTMQAGELPPLPEKGGTIYHNNPERWNKDLREWWRREVREDAFDLKDDLRRDTWDISEEQRATAVRASAEGQPLEISSEALEVLADIDKHANTVRLGSDQTLTRSMRIANDEDFKWLDWWTDPDVGDELTAAMPDSWSLDADWSAQFVPTKFDFPDDALRATQSVDVVMTIRSGERVRMMPVHSAKGTRVRTRGPGGRTLPSHIAPRDVRGGPDRNHFPGASGHHPAHPPGGRGDPARLVRGPLPAVVGVVERLLLCVGVSLRPQPLVVVALPPAPVGTGQPLPRLTADVGRVRTGVLGRAGDLGHVGRAQIPASYRCSGSPVSRYFSQASALCSACSPTLTGMGAAKRFMLSGGRSVMPVPSSVSAAG